MSSYLFYFQVPGETYDMHFRFEKTGVIHNQNILKTKKNSE